MARKVPAFSLIEMAIVLIIIGLISGMALPALKTTLEWQKNATTAQNQEKIIYALASYAVQNKILPCAADPTGHSGKQEKNRRRGIVPYSDLNLPESLAKDGYQRWFTYVVDDYYNARPLKVIGFSSHQPITRLCEKADHLNSLSIKSVQKSIAFALISHGPQGRGAYPNPSAIPPQGQDETQNATSDTEIIDRPLSQDPSNPFSHKVLWATAQNLLALYGHAPCPSVEETKPQAEKTIYQLPKNPINIPTKMPPKKLTENK